MESRKAFVLGNGVSRNGINLKSLQEKGKVYGCNALYRDFKPDYLVAVDIKMIREIYESGYSTNNLVYANPHKLLDHMTSINFLDPALGWSSGPTALWLATTHGYDEIYVLGFDFIGLNNGRLFNNVYADSQNYKRSVQPATYYRNWLKQTATVIKHNKHIRYIRVIEPDGFDTSELSNFSNYTTIYKNDFEKLLK